MNRSKFAMLGLCIALANGSNLYANGFYTIIGPDGRPMIVPKKVSENGSISTQKHDIRRDLKSPGNLSDIKQLSSEKKQSAIKIDADSGSESVVHQKEIMNQNDVAIHVSSKDNAGVTPKITQLEQAGHTQLDTKKEVRAVIVNNDISKQPKVSIMPTTQSSQPMLNDMTEQEDLAFSKVDGVEYVNSEYLESQEFNLEGKKRFYSMPDGTGRLETIERKKGISRSVLDKFTDKAQQSNVPISLSSSYIRLSSDELVLAFEKDRCFVNSYSKSIKTLTPKKEVGLWPRKPLKEKFEYELVKLDSSIQFMQIESYAATNEKPNYYWPLVIFLNEEGCIQEGVSGFKNGKTAATLFQHSALQGTIKVPPNAHYMMITPLASAVDVLEEELSNQGQVRISVLQ